jgi:hypothetical protein
MALLLVVLVLDGMTISFVHAYTLPGTDPARAITQLRRYRGYSS